MATIHTDLPKDIPGHHGEYVVGQILKNFVNSDLELWFGINYLSGVPDLDLIIADKKVGLYLIEIKSMSLDSIKTFTPTEFVLERGEKRQHPTTQLRVGSESLRKFLKNSKTLTNPKSMPFVQTAVLWSEINRNKWKERFKNTNMSTYHEFCLFKDDLGTYNYLISALQRLWDRPLLGVSPPSHARGEHGAITSFREAISPVANTISLSSSMSEEIARPVVESKRISEKYEIGKKHMVSLQGAPGTGKTTILREIGLRNLQAGAAVLHVCFNKVLAADQKREYQLLRQTGQQLGFLDVYDVWELYKILGHVGGPGSEDKLINNVEKFLNQEETKNFIKYDVILVDESQDLPQVFFQVLELIARPSASWFVSYGKGQETFHFTEGGQHPCAWLNQFLEQSDKNILRRSFRNSTKAFLLAQAFWEKYPKIQDGKKWLNEKFSQNNSSENQFELDLLIPQTKNDFRIEVLPQGKLRKSFIRNLVLSALEEAKQANRGGDLLIATLAPSTKASTRSEGALVSSYPLLAEVLTEISRDFEIDFYNLVPKNVRREIPKIGAIRLVTLQNIRGLSASHVLIFDLDKLEKWAESSGTSLKPPFVNSTYIALSRSKASTIVAIESSAESKVEDYLLDLVGYASELALKKGN